MTGKAHLCGVCSGAPQWTVTRLGDNVVSWVCGHHLQSVCTDLQRAHEHTELHVVRFATPIAEVNARIREELQTCR